MEKVVLDIAGMRCGACGVGIELALGKKKGVKSANVSLDERMAAVEYTSFISYPLDSILFIVQKSIIISGGQICNSE